MATATMPTFETPEGYEQLIEEFEEDTAYEMNANIGFAKRYKRSCNTCEFYTGNFKSQELNSEFAKDHENLHPGHLVNIATVDHFRYNKREQ